MPTMLLVRPRATDFANVVTDATQCGSDARAHAPARRVGRRTRRHRSAPPASRRAAPGRARGRARRCRGSATVSTTCGVGRTVAEHGPAHRRQPLAHLVVRRLQREPGGVGGGRVVAQVEHHLHVREELGTAVVRPERVDEGREPRLDRVALDHRVGERARRARGAPRSCTASISASRVPKWYWITPHVTPARFAILLELAR